MACPHLHGALGIIWAAMAASTGDVWMSFGQARSYWLSLGHTEDRLIDLWIECPKMWVSVPNNPAWYDGPDGRLLRVDPDGSMVEIFAKVRIHPVRSAF